MASNMFLLASSIVLLFIVSCEAHTYLSSVKIAGTAYGEGDCVRLTGSNSPIPTVTDAQMTCGFKPKADTAANRMCPVTAGSKMGLQWWYEHPNSPQDGFLVVDPSHRGPCIVYMAKNDGSTPKWFKVFEDGYDPVTKKFCVDKLIEQTNGLLEFTIPSDIAPGNYFVRGEVIALHGAYAVNGAQPYVGCAEVKVSGSGTAQPNTVSLPGAYSPNDPGILVSIYDGTIDKKGYTYVVPGPKVYVSGSSSGSTPAPGSTNPPTKAPGSTNSPTKAPGSTNSPTIAPGSTNPPTKSPQVPTNCQVGSANCNCTVGGACDQGLICSNKICIDASQKCTGDVGSENCACTVGGACDKGLSCNTNKVCKPVDDAALVQGSPASLIAPCFFLISAIVVAIFM